MNSINFCETCVVSRSCLMLSRPSSFNRFPPFVKTFWCICRHKVTILYTLFRISDLSTTSTLLYKSSKTLNKHTISLYLSISVSIFKDFPKSIITKSYIPILPSKIIMLLVCKSRWV